MADSPQKAAVESDPTQGLLGGDTFNNLKSQWDTFLSDPGGRAALLSAGISLMQPPSFADTGASQIGRAIGTAGETVSTREAMDLKAADAASKAAARESAAAGRETSASRAEDKLAITKMDVESKIALRKAQEQAVPIKAEATRLRAEAASETNAIRRDELLARAKHYDDQAANYVSQAEARSEQAAIARDRLEQTGRTGDIQNRIRQQAVDLRTQQENTTRRMLGQPELPLPSTGAAAGATAPATSTGGVRVNTPAEADRLAPGTVYQTPDGRTFTR